MSDKKEIKVRGGQDGRFLPTVQLQKLEQDDDKRTFIGKSLQNILSINRAFDEPVRTDHELCERLDWFFETCANTNQLPTVEKMCLSIGWPRETVFEMINGIRKGFSPHTADILKKAKNLIETAFNDYKMGVPADFMAVNLSLAAETLGEITGMSISEEIVDRIFKEFCVGK